MNGSSIKLVISDFDGTLFDTFRANFLAYKEVLYQLGYTLTENQYSDSFGLRLNEFMHMLKIHDTQLITKIKHAKSIVYPKYFKYIIINKPLLLFLTATKRSGGKVALATTAQKNNVTNVLKYFDISNFFDFAVYSEDIKESKPNPECYNKIIEYFNLCPSEVLIFEDSKVGEQAASKSGANYMMVNQLFYGY